MGELERVTAMRREGRTFEQIARVLGVGLDRVRFLVDACYACGLLDEAEAPRRALLRRSSLSRRSNRSPHVVELGSFEDVEP